MADVYSKKKRSWLMARIRSKNTGPEKVVFSFLRKKHVHFQRHYRHAPGNPDVAVPSSKLAVFVNGDFWHGRNYQRTKQKLKPFWRNKIAGNILRDKKNMRKLRAAGWRVLNIWSGDLEKNPPKALDRIKTFLEMSRK